MLSVVSILRHYGPPEGRLSLPGLAYRSAEIAALRFEEGSYFAET